MTTIAYRDGILAADSCETSEDEDAGTCTAGCEKLFRVGPFIVALQGESTPGLVWLNWFHLEWDNAREPELQLVPQELTDRFLDNKADFTAVVLTKNRGLWIYDEWGTPAQITAPYYAVGSGMKAALGAMHAGAGAVAAVEAACAHDPYTSGPVHSSETLK